jgi:hypothetical protein
MNPFADEYGKLIINDNEKIDAFVNE